MSKMWHLSATEEHIVNAINLIREKHKRPVAKDIFDEINKNKDDNEIINITEFDEALENLKLLNIVYDGGKGGRESYFIRETSNANNFDSLGNAWNTVPNLQEFIDDKFFEVLKNNIKSEVENQVLSLFNKHNVIHKNSFNIPDDKIDNNEIITILKNELEFLKNEIASKDKIINMLLEDKLSIVPEIKENNTNDNKDNDPFIYPRKHSENRQDNNRAVNNTIQLNNHYDLLNTTAVTNCVDARGNDLVNSTINSDNGTVNRNRQNKNRSITIVGDSIIKDVKGFKMKKSIARGDKLYVKSYSGATTNCMTDHIKPSLKYNPDLVIIHCGSNDLRSQKSPNTIANEIIDLTLKSKTVTNDVVISGLVARNDELNLKGKQLNECLISKCEEKNIFYIDNTNIVASKHLNGSGLHLNHLGTSQLAKNFLNCINL